MRTAYFFTVRITGVDGLSGLGRLCKFRGKLVRGTSDLALSTELQRVFYALRRAGASSGGVISNALAVQHVIENEPTRATRATSSSTLKDASADA